MHTQRENHLMDAEKTNPELIRVILSSLPRAGAINTPAGTVAILRSQVVAAGLDTLAVTRWLQPIGGFGAVAYLRPPSQRLSNAPTRAALHPVSYFTVPVEALDAPAAQPVDVPVLQRSASG